MQKEKELLGILDSIVDGILAGTPADGFADWAASLARLAARAADHAAGLALAGTANSARDLAILLTRTLATSEAAARDEFGALLQTHIEELHFTAEQELAGRFDAAVPARPGALPQPVEISALKDFVVESREHLDTIERELLALETAGSLDPVHAIFRGFHTIKGLAGVFGLPGPRQLAHQVEALLELIRSGDLAVSRPLIDALFAACDYLRSIVDTVDAGSAAVPDAPAELWNQLRNQLAPGSAAASAPARPATRAAAVTAETVKVDTARLDSLVDMVGELMIAQSLVRMDPSLRNSDPRLARNLAALGRITAELQKTAMSLRVVPIAPAFRRMTRLFRDLIAESGKDATLELSGEDFELDRTIVEQLADPLMHMVRNAIDHGLETPSERERRGKPRQGRVRLAASQQSGSVVIEISDDGRGLDHDRILQKAKERGLVAPDATLSPNEIVELIFEPGFSTAASVTEVSGRGVGMDVVRKQIHRLRGRIEVRSESGNGSTFLLKLPLTLAIIDGLIVRLASERYIVPLPTVQEILKPGPGMVSTIENHCDIALVRDRVYPIVRLDRLLGRPARFSRPADATLVLIEIDQRQYCLAVDDVVGKQEIVIKNLGSWIGHLPGVSGGAILGDGAVGLILDLQSLLGRELNAA